MDLGAHWPLLSLRNMLVLVLTVFVLVSGQESSTVISTTAVSDGVNTTATESTTSMPSSTSEVSTPLLSTEPTSTTTVTMSVTTAVTSDTTTPSTVMTTSTTEIASSSTTASNMTERTGSGRAINLEEQMSTSPEKGSLQDLSLDDIEEPSINMTTSSPAPSTTSSPTPSTTDMPSSSTTESVTNTTTSLNGTKCVEPGREVNTGCSEKCECGSDGHLVCEPRCPAPQLQRSVAVRTLDPACTLRPVEDPCCALLVCTQADTETEPLEGCIYKNETHQRGGTFMDGCGTVCTCGEAGHVSCKSRCPPVANNSTSDRCVALPDPTDPCCTVVLCDVTLADHDVGKQGVEEPNSIKHLQVLTAELVNQTAVLLVLEPQQDNVTVESSLDQVTWQRQDSDDLLVTGLKPGTTYYLRAKVGSLVSNAVQVSLPDKEPDNKMSGCMYKGKQYEMGDEFHDGCEAFCACTDTGVQCATIECPTDFGLDVLDPTCVSWEMHPADFTPTPPNCCPDHVRCRDNGSCIYEGEQYPNWAEIPMKITGCDKRCYCEFGNITCQSTCPPVGKEPPTNLACPPSAAVLNHLPGDDCCLYWMCPQQPLHTGNGTEKPDVTVQDHRHAANSTAHHKHAFLPLNPDYMPGPLAPFFGEVPLPPQVHPNHSLEHPPSPKDHNIMVEIPPHRVMKVPEAVQPYPHPIQQPKPASRPGKPHPPLVIPAQGRYPPNYPFPPPEIYQPKPGRQPLPLDNTHSIEELYPTKPNHRPLDNTQSVEELYPIKPNRPPFVNPEELYPKKPNHPPFDNTHSIEELYPIKPNRPPSDKTRPTEELYPTKPNRPLPPEQVYPIPPQVVARPHGGHLIPPNHPSREVYPIPIHPQNIPNEYILQESPEDTYPKPPRRPSQGSRRPQGAVYPPQVHIQGGAPDPHLEQILMHLQNQGLLPAQYTILQHPEHTDIDQLLQHSNQSHQACNETRSYSCLFRLAYSEPGCAERATTEAWQLKMRLANHTFTKVLPTKALTAGGFAVPPPHPGFGPQHSVGRQDEITVQTLEAIDDSTVRLVFSVPPVLVGLHGRVELRYTADKQNMDPSTWLQQVFAPPGDLIATPQLEFELGDLQPDTVYNIKVTLNLRDLHNSPSSPILSVRTLPRAVPVTTLPPQIPIDVALTVAEVNSTWAKLLWRKFSEFELQFIDGVQLRYKEKEGKVYLATPLIHRAVTSYTLEGLRPRTQYEVGIFFIPFPGQTTELMSEHGVQLTTADVTDPYKFNITLEVSHIKSTSVELSWSGVPYPEDKYVNVYRAIYQSDAGKEDFSSFKIAKRDAPSRTMIQDLKPGTRYRLWLEVYLTNGRIKKSNVQDFITKPGAVPAVGATQQGQLKAGSHIEPIVESSDYYGPLVAVAIIAALAILAALILLLILMRKHGTNKAAISASRKTQSAYDNPSYKTSENNGEQVTTNGGAAPKPAEQQVQQPA